MINKIINNTAILGLVFLFTLFLFFCGCSPEDNETSSSFEIDLNKYESNPQDSTSTHTMLCGTSIYDFIMKNGLVGEKNVLSAEVFEFDLSYLSFGDTSSGKSKGIEGKFLDGFEFNVPHEDSAYIHEQIIQNRNKLWDFERLGNAETMRHYNNWCFQHPEFDWDKFKESGFGCFIQLSAPIFTADHKTAFIYVSYSCQALLGAGNYYKYQLFDGKWELTGTINAWTS